MKENIHLVCRISVHMARRWGAICYISLHYYTINITQREALRNYLRNCLGKIPNNPVIFSECFPNHYYTMAINIEHIIIKPLILRKSSRSYR